MTQTWTPPLRLEGAGGVDLFQPRKARKGTNNTKTTDITDRHGLFSTTDITDEHERY